MRSSILSADGGRRTHVVILDEGEDAVAALGSFAKEHRITAAQLTAIGAFSATEVAFWDTGAKQYRSGRVDRQAEVLSLVGDIVLDEHGEPACHIHVVLGLEDFSVRGGHLKSATVRPTLEVIVNESPAHLQRRFDPKLGLAVIVPQA
ncbi:DNA-binding protein [Roseomonas terrae]|uniref:DNA-binding protein n=1 Tax=Neoroseomonas terrae TaxID=424799 RepID=A0ABS5EJT4_9PROT|nr:PPC domain-containing DNA-binding protein [Neoroseomonas terrae]MBR0651230.1 DNA-binding protein [Neoroseomonas terrae]